MSTIDSLILNGDAYAIGSPVSGDSLFETSPVYNLILSSVNGFVEGNLDTTSGQLNNDTRYKTSPYVAVSDNLTTLYRVSKHSDGSHYRTCCYNSSKTYLSEATLTSYNYEYYNSDGVRYDYFKFTLPEGTKYVRTAATTAQSSLYLSENNIPNGFDIDAITVSTEYQGEILSSLGVPNIETYNRYKGKKMIVAGDSITESNSTNNNKPWHTWLAKWLGLTVYNDGKGGTGFAKNYMSQGSTIYRIENNWASLYPSAPDIILVMGNQNDGTGEGGGYSDTYPSAVGLSKPPVGSFSDPSTTCSEYGIMRRLLEDLTTAYPKAKIGIISSTPRDLNMTDKWPSNPKSYGMGWYHDYVVAQKEVCADFGVPFLDIYHQNPVLRPYNGTNAVEFYWDGTTNTPTGAVHPNEKGHLEGIARPVYEWMLEWI